MTKDEYNRCELPVLSVSKQMNKAVTNSKDREIMAETDKFQEMRTEIQHKRQNDYEETERRGAEIKETGEPRPASKRQRKYAVPKRTAWRQTRDIRMKGETETEKLMTDERETAKNPGTEPDENPEISHAETEVRSKKK